MTSVMELLLGEWTGTGKGAYPTIEPFAYREQLTVSAVPDKPFAMWRSTTQDATSGVGRHVEVGFLRGLADGSAELLVTHGSGLAEIAVAAAPVDGRVEFRSTVVAGTPTAKEVTEVVRRFVRHGDELSYELDMAAVGIELTHHLDAVLRRNS